MFIFTIIIQNTYYTVTKNPNTNLVNKIHINIDMHFGSWVSKILFV